MKLRFLLDDVQIELVDSIPTISEVLYTDEFYKINTNEFILHVEDVVDFYATNGNSIMYSPIGEPDYSAIELYLNGSVLGAILHQRKQLPIHGSCFHYNERTVLISGASGAGKSTLTAAFCQRGGEFLTDDITPIIEVNGQPCVSPISDSIKLWGDSIDRLQLREAIIAPVQNNMDKYYVDLAEGDTAPLALDCFIILSYDNSRELTIREITGAEKFDMIINQIYRKEYLQGMPSLQRQYFNQLIKVCKQMPFFAVSRPDNTIQAKFTDAIESLIEALE